MIFTSPTDVGKLISTLVLEGIWTCEIASSITTKFSFFKTFTTKVLLTLTFEYDTVAVALELFKKLGLIYEEENKVIVCLCDEAKKPYVVIEFTERM